MSVAIAVVTAVIAFPAKAGEPTVSSPPHIVVILADDLGWADVNCFDPVDRGFYETPNIDALAEQGVQFTHAYSNGANCSPTRAALVSGQYYPHQPIYHVGSPSQGKLIPAENGRRLPPEKITIAEALNEGGYTSALIGKWHIGKPPDAGPVAQGFDVNIGGYSAGNPNNWEGGYFKPNNNPYIDEAKPGEYLTDYLTRKAVDFIEAQCDAPFYLQLSYYTPHFPYQAPETLVQKYRQKEPQGGHHHATYGAMIEAMDRGVGRIMNALERLGIAQNTLFIFYSDNGGRGGYRDLGRGNNGTTDNSPLKSGKGSFYEGGIRVPLIARWPGKIQAGTQCDEPVIGIDLYPTFLEAAGLVQPGGYLLDGTSLMPLFDNPGSSLDRDALYWHFPGYPNAKWRSSPVSVIRSGPWKLMKFYETGAFKLYNLKDDISEQNNLAKKRPEVRDRLKSRLEHWLDDNNAPMPRQRNSDTSP